MNRQYRSALSGCTVVAIVSALNAIAASAQDRPVRISSEHIDTDTVATYGKGLLDEPLPIQLSFPQRGMTFEDAKQKIADRYRLIPDRRILHAVREIHRFLEGGVDGPVEVTFTDTDWQIRFAGLDAGLLEDMPDFDDALLFLDRWVDVVKQSNPIVPKTEVTDAELAAIDALIEEFFLHPLVRAGKRIDGLWKQSGPDSRLIQRAARLYTYVLYQRHDRFEGYDETYGKALALAVLANNLGVPPPPSDMALLAHVLRYSGYARRTVELLDPLDPKRLAVYRDAPRLKTLSQLPDASVFTKFAYLWRLGESGDGDEFLNYMNTAFDERNDPRLSVMTVGLQSGSFALAEGFGSAMPRAAVVALGGETGLWPRAESRANKPKLPPSWIDRIDRLDEMSLPELAAEFTHCAAAASAQFTGPFMNGEDVTLIFESFFTSGIVDLGLHYKFSLASNPATREYADELDSEAHPLLNGAAAWLRGLVDAEANDADPVQIVQAAVAHPRLGVGGLDSTYQSARNRIQYAYSASMEIPALLARRLDSRPSGRKLLVDIAALTLCDPKLMEEMYESLFAVAREQYIAINAWYANYRRDSAYCLALLDSEWISIETKGYIVALMAQTDGLDEEAVVASFEKLRVLDPKNWDLAKRFGVYLRNKRRFAESRAVVRSWLDEGIEVLGLENHIANALIADAYWREGLYDEGMKTIRPFVPGYQADVLREYGRLQYSTGDKIGAFDTFRKAAVRYPDNIVSWADVAALHWQDGNHDEAAKTLRSYPRAPNQNDWGNGVWPVFFETFNEGQVNEASSAVGAILKAGLGSQEALSTLDAAARQARMPEIAASAWRTFIEAGNGNQAMLLDAYRAIKSTQSREDALAWLAPRIPESERNESAVHFYRANQYDLLWDLIPNPEAGPNADQIWRLRAVAAAIAGPKNDPHYEELVSHFQEPSADYTRSLGRLTIGLADEREALALATSPVRVCEVAYYMGARAQGEGRLRDAVDWYRISVETRRANKDEYLWAFDALYRLRSTGMSLDAMAANLSPGDVASL